MPAKFLLILPVIFLLQLAQVSAQEIYAARETRNGETSEHYVLTETIQKMTFDGLEGFKVRLHTVGKNFSYNKYRKLGF